MNATMTAIRKVDHVTKNDVGRIVWGSRFLIAMKSERVDGHWINKQVLCEARQYTIVQVDEFGVARVSLIKKDGSLSEQLFATGDWCMLTFVESDYVTEVREDA